MEREGFISFPDMLENLRNSRDRDPKMLRIRSILSALSDVRQSNGSQLSPAMIYSDLYSTLEGTMRCKYEDAGKLIDGILTQTAILHIVESTLEHVDPSFLSSTMPNFSKLMRGLIESTVAFEKISNHEATLSTVDGFGPAASVLNSVCSVSSTLLCHTSRPGANFDKVAIRSLLRTTVLQSLCDERERVHRHAQKKAMHLLESIDDGFVLETVNAFVLNIIGDLPRSQQEQKKLVLILRFVQVANSHLNSFAIGERIMILLVQILKEMSSGPCREPRSEQDIQYSTKIAVLNSLLSTILALLDVENNDNQLVDFSARVLATLLQSASDCVLDCSDVELVESAYLVYGQVVLSSVKRLLDEDYSTGCQLLPLTIVVLLRLSGAATDSIGNGIGQALFSQLCPILSSTLLSVAAKDKASHTRCCSACVSSIRPVLFNTHMNVPSAAWTCLANVLIQSETKEAFVIETLKLMVSFRDGIGADSSSLTAIDNALKCIMGGIGIEKFWQRIAFSWMCTSAEAGRYLWLLNIMKMSVEDPKETTTGLAFFQDKVLQLVASFDTAVSSSDTNRNACRAMVIALWGLFPCFCLAQRDDFSSLSSLHPVLIRALHNRQYPEVVPIIATGLKVLASVVPARPSQLGDNAKIQRKHMGPTINSFVQFSEMMLPSLFKVAVHSEMNQRYTTGDNASEDEQSRIFEVTLYEAIAALAGNASASLVQKLFAKVMQRLLQESQREDCSGERMCSLLSLSEALVVSGNLHERSLTLLYRSLKPLALTDETPPKVQKRVFKVLVAICHSELFQSVDGQISDLFSFLLASANTSQSAARLARLRLMEAVLVSMASTTEFSPSIETPLSILSEVLLGLKDSNKRTREKACLVMFRLCDSIGNVSVVIKGVLSTLASESAYTRSAAVLGLTRLLQHYGKSQQSIHTIFGSIMQTILLMMDDTAREVVKSVVGFVRVSIVACPRNVVEPIVPLIVDGLLKYHRGRGRFKQKIKIVIQKLLQMFGSDFLENLFPEEDKNLLRNVQKSFARETRRKQKSEMQNHDLVWDEAGGNGDDDNGSYFDGKRAISDDSLQPQRARDRKYSRSNGQAFKCTPQGTKRRGASTVLIQEDKGSHVLEISSITRHSMEYPSDDCDDDSDQDVAFDESGKLVIVEKRPSLSGTEANIYEADAAAGALYKARSEKKATAGDNYRSRRAGGDVKRKGQRYDPYAFLPLDGKNYSKRNRLHAVEKMESVLGRGRKRQKK